MSAVADKRVAGGSSDSGQKIALAVLGVILVLLLIWQVPKLLGSSDSTSDTTPVAAVGAVTPVADQTATAGTEAVASPAGQTAASIARERKATRLIKRLPSRDPFVPLAGAAPATPAPVATPTPAPTPTPTPTPKPTPAPVVVPTAAMLWINGRRQVVGVKQTFKVGDTTFRLVGVTKTTATIVPVVGALDGGKSQIKLARTQPVTIENTATGVQYVIRFSQAMSTVSSGDAG